MRIGMLGAGLMGRALGRAWARRGHAMTVSYARDRARHDALAREAGGGARAGTPPRRWPTQRPIHPEVRRRSRTGSPR
jgi:predicted dinucleotide-binding enzyme